MDRNAFDLDIIFYINIGLLNIFEGDTVTKIERG